MSKSPKVNQARLHAEILRVVVRCAVERKNATVGEVERRLDMGYVPRERIEAVLRDFWCAGILDKEEFMYRKNVKSSRYLPSQEAKAHQFINSQIMWVIAPEHKWNATRAAADI